MGTRYVPYKPAALSAIALQRPAARSPPLYTAAFVVCLCFTAYLLGTWQRGGDALIAAATTTSIPIIKTTCAHLSKDHEKTSAAAATELDFKPNHTQHHLTGDVVVVGIKHHYPPCHVNYSEYTPCEDPERSLRFNRNRMIYRERHCPEKHELLKCRVPPPYGYRTPFKWPESRDHAWYVNVPHRELTIEKAVQNWILYEGDRFRFPGGGTMFPNGADAYIDDIAKLINLKDGSIRTAIDTGCGVASWGSYLASRNIITMSFAPRDTHEAQVQFALERGVPALIGVLASKRLPYPSRAFDMAHCSRCLIPWGQYDGQYLIEVDRVLRPGGYWILSGPPIRWRRSWKGWNRTMPDLNDEQKGIEKVARTLCWKKIVEKNDISIWQKPTNHIHCKLNKKRIIPLPPFCLPPQDPDKAWYTNIDSCLTPLPEVSNIREVAGGKVRKWPERLNAVPPRISQGSIEGLTTEMFQKDIQLWNKRVSYYKTNIKKLQIAEGYRNLLDMNANMGGFAAALVKDAVWVMNVVPVEAKDNTLGVIYERGLIGTYQSWCEAMSTYPRTYDLIHADSLFSLYIHRCEMEDIMLEMDRILRPEGSMIIRDDVDVVMKVKRVADGMDYNTHIIDHEDGPLVREKLLIAVKSYWTAPASSVTHLN